jgi:2,4-dienoyl-CoA reductase-like NADH-dependent reductase (Old Yellow Enzyme family)/thioredoxin reductase
MGSHNLYPNVYKPIRIGPVEVKNRLFQTPHGSAAVNANPAYGLADHIYARDPADGSPVPHPDVIDYYEERARGGLGLIIMGHVEVQKFGSGRWHLTTGTAVDAFRPLADRVHRHGTKLFAQLHCGFGAASAIPGAGFVGEGFPEPLSTHDIKRIVGLVGLSAKNAREAGLDGVELHAAHLHSVGLFLSGFTNRRDDAYGGSRQNRMRFALECLYAIREAVGDTIAVGIRMPCDERLPGGIDSGEAREIAQRLDELKLLDFFDLDMGHSQHMWDVYPPHYQPPSYQVPHIAKVRDAIRDAVVLGCPGRLGDPAEAERIIASGAMDMVGGVRGLYADPEWPRKGFELRAEEIRPCIGLGSCVYEGQCVMNPGMYLEALYGVTKIAKTEAPKRLVVVGGGPAGLEAARMAALRGHTVTLVERSDALGGALKLQAKLPTRDGVLRAATWWGGQLESLGVTVALGTEATAAEVVAFAPDVVVVATGATFDRTGVNGLTGREIPGWDRPFVYTPETLLSAVPKVTGRAVVCDEDGAMTGTDIACLLAQSGASDVHLVTRHAATAQTYVGKAGNHRDLSQMQVRRLGVRVATETFIKEISDHAVTVYDIWTDEERVLDDVEIVVLVNLRRPVSKLADDLRDEVPAISVLGDASKPGRMAKATRDGFLFGWNL